MKALGYIGAFLGGAIAGTALGMIFAPEKGEDTRSKIAGAVDDFCKKHDIKLSTQRTLTTWLTISRMLLLRFNPTQLPRISTSTTYYYLNKR